MVLRRGGSVWFVGGGGMEAASYVVVDFYMHIVYQLIVFN